MFLPGPLQPPTAHQDQTSSTSCAFAAWKNPAESPQGESCHFSLLGSAGMAGSQEDRWHRDSTVLQTRDVGSTCSVTRCCPTAQMFPLEPQGSAYPSLAWLLCLFSVISAFPAFPAPAKPCSVSQTVSPNPQHTDVVVEEAAWLL